MGGGGGGGEGEGLTGGLHIVRRLTLRVYGMVVEMSRLLIPAVRSACLITNRTNIDRGSGCCSFSRSGCSPVCLCRGLPFISWLIYEPVPLSVCESV